MTSSRRSLSERFSGLVAGTAEFFFRLGEVVGPLVLSALYVLLIGPFALFSRIFTDPLRYRRPSDSAFLAREKDGLTMREARRQG